MKICYICSEYPEGPHGGIGTFVREVARKFVSEGHSVKVIGVYFRNYPAPDYEVDHGVEVFRIRKGDGKFDWISAWLRQYRMVKEWALNGEVDIVEAADSSGWFAFWPKMNIPLVIRCHGSNTYFSHLNGKKPNKLTNLLEKKSLKRADFYCSVSRFTAEKTRQLFKIDREFELIYNGIKTPSPDENIKREKGIVVFSGTLIEKKGVIQLIQAANLLYDRGVDFHLYLFGKDTQDPVRGSVKKFLEGLIGEEVRDKIHFMGNVPRTELFTFYQKATVAVFPSFMEAFAFAPIESMAYGCPTVYSDQTSGRELIDDGVNGFLVDPYKPEEIADALQRILTDPALAKEIGARGIEKSKEFSSDIMEEKTINFYKQCIEDFKNGRSN